MEKFISDIKSVVIVIVASEFLKNFLIGGKFKKYITVCVNILVIGYIISQITSQPLYYNDEKINFTFESGSYENKIKSVYEDRINSELINKLKENKINVYEIKTTANDDYSIKNIIVTVDDGYDKTEEIIKGLKPENYEIIIFDKK